MKFEQKGNLGKVELLQRHLILKQGLENNQPITLEKEEVNEILDQLSKFNGLLANLNLYANPLKKDGYSAIVDIINKLEPYYREYKED